MERSTDVTAVCN